MNNILYNDENPTDYFCVSFELPAHYLEDDAAKISVVFEEEAYATTLLRAQTKEGHVIPASLEDHAWKIEWYFGYAPQIDFIQSRLQPILDDLQWGMPDLLIEKVPEKDWLAESYQSFPPFVVEPFFIFGSHYTESVPANYIPLQIDAATAFGSGEHGTTRGCLEMLSFVFKNNAVTSILDMGTGSGILAIAAWHLCDKDALKNPIIGIDIDEESIRVANLHKAANISMTDLQDDDIIFAAGDGYHTALSRQYAPYDLIIANILARPLVMMAPDLKQSLAPQGHVILSGLLMEQAEMVLDAHKAQGLIEKHRITHGEWVTLWLSVA
jgi:ribosomal protein L11 methyltransferase